MLTGVTSSSSPMETTLSERERAVTPDPTALLRALTDMNKALSDGQLDEALESLWMTFKTSR